MKCRPASDLRMPTAVAWILHDDPPYCLQTPLPAPHYAQNKPVRILPIALIPLRSLPATAACGPSANGCAAKS